MHGSSDLAIPPQDLVAFKGIAPFTGVAAFAFFRRLLLHFKHRRSQLCLQCIIANGMFLHRHLLIEWLWLALANNDNYDTLVHQAFLFTVAQNLRLLHCSFERTRYLKGSLSNDVAVTFLGWGFG